MDVQASVQANRARKLEKEGSLWQEQDLAKDPPPNRAMVEPPPAPEESPSPSRPISIRGQGFKADLSQWLACTVQGDIATPNTAPSIRQAIFIVGFSPLQIPNQPLTVFPKPSKPRSLPRRTEL